MDYKFWVIELLNIITFHMLFSYKVDLTRVWPHFFSLNLQELFDFGGVYVNSTKSIPFLLQNKGQARTRVEFDFFKYKDFKLSANDHSGICFAIPLFIK